MAPLARPIFGEVSADGRLLRADEALSRLNKRAGGEDGAMLAIPALASLAQLSVRLQMQLSRSVRVADGPENLELWVEVKPEPTFARLAIIGWQVLSEPVASTYSVRDDVQTDYPDAMLFNASHRLVRANGIAAGGLVAEDFGKTAADVLLARYQNNDELEDLLAAINGARGFQERLLIRSADGQHLRVTGRPVDNGHGPNGYRMLFAVTPTPEGDLASNQSAGQPAALFGKHLAPALRQPLGRIIANAETIGSELQGPIRENYALYARDIADAARHLSALVEDLGDLEAIERPGFQTARDQIDLGDVARRVAGLLALKAADHSIRILAPQDSHAAPAVAEFRRTLQILLNLVSNAIRYSPDGTDVRIDTACGKSFTSVSVVDQGKGIAIEDRDKVFEKFERLGRSGDGGSGLGLYISRRLAEAMGGALTVDSADGGGAKFTLRLPNH
ncbi:MAG: HAMP domain-containing histidine kinase [Sphingomonadaceae bacterium]|nr:HAMP domain-containing histidine kinase [Sphingomonadaceae bacterium]